jgi:hypothetical protein
MIIETPQWKLALEVHPADWRFSAGITWLAGWLWSPQNRVTTDLRAWVDGRCFLANWGLPKPGLDEVYLKRPGPPYLGFTLLLAPHAGASLLRLEVRDQTNGWTQVFQTPISVAEGAAGCPPPKSLPALLPQQLNPLLQLQVRRPAAHLDTLADEIISGAIAEPCNSLPNPPFFGALEAPREIGWVRYGRLSITGWLAHRDPRAADRFYQSIIRRCEELPPRQVMDQRRRRPFGALRRMGQIDADADGQPQPAGLMRSGLDQHARRLLTRQHHVIGPFDRHQRRRGPGIQQVRDGESGDEGHLRGLGGRFSGQLQQGGKIELILGPRS